jgi:hypothetical protein
MHQFFLGAVWELGEERGMLGWPQYFRELLRPEK